MNFWNSFVCVCSDIYLHVCLFEFCRCRNKKVKDAALSKHRLLKLKILLFLCVYDLFLKFWYKRLLYLVCFLFMEKVGFRRVSERFFGEILFCRFDSWSVKFPAFVFLYSSFVQTTRLNPKPVLWRKNTISDNF